MERQTYDGVVLGHRNSHAHYPGNEWSEYHIDLLSTSAITLRPGWNLAGYQGAQTTDILTALNSLGATYDIVFGFDQSRGGVTSYFTDPNKSLS